MSAKYVTYLLLVSVSFQHSCKRKTLFVVILIKRDLFARRQVQIDCPVKQPNKTEQAWAELCQTQVKLEVIVYIVEEAWS